MFNYKNAIHNQNECAMHELRSSAFLLSQKIFLLYFLQEDLLYLRKNFSEINLMFRNYILNIDNDKSLRKFIIKNLYPGQTVI